MFYFHVYKWACFIPPWTNFVEILSFVFCKLIECYTQRTLCLNLWYRFILRQIFTTPAFYRGSNITLTTSRFIETNTHSHVLLKLKSVLHPTVRSLLHQTIPVIAIPPFLLTVIDYNIWPHIINNITILSSIDQWASDTLLERSIKKNYGKIAFNPK